MTNCFQLILSLFYNFTKLHLLNAFVYFLIFETGHYEDAVRQQDANDPLQRVADRGVLSFGKRTGRHDSVGAFGERPDMAVEMDRQDGEIEGQMLDIEAGVSRDRPDRKSSGKYSKRKRACIAYMEAL